VGLAAAAGLAVGLAGELEAGLCTKQMQGDLKNGLWVWVGKLPGLSSCPVWLFRCASYPNMGWIGSLSSRWIGGWIGE